jgi:hypothetical protein
MLKCAGAHAAAWDTAAVACMRPCPRTWCALVNLVHTLAVGDLELHDQVAVLVLLHVGLPCLHCMAPGIRHCMVSGICGLRSLVHSLLHRVIAQPYGMAEGRMRWRLETAWARMALPRSRAAASRPAESRATSCAWPLWSAQHPPWARPVATGSALELCRPWELSCTPWVWERSRPS